MQLPNADQQDGMGAGGGGGGQDIDFGEQPPGMADMPTPAVGGPSSGPQYPSVMLTGDQSLSKIPDEGRMMIHHSVISRRQHTPQHGPHKGKMRHEVEIHIKKGRPMRSYKKAEPKSKLSPDESRMRKLMGDQEAEE